MLILHELNGRLILHELNGSLILHELNGRLILHECFRFHLIFKGEQILSMFVQCILHNA